jgi:hypothetical protein
MWKDDSPSEILQSQNSNVSSDTMNIRLATMDPVQDGSAQRPTVVKPKDSIVEVPKAVEEPTPEDKRISGHENHSEPQKIADEKVDDAASDNSLENMFGMIQEEAKRKDTLPEVPVLNSEEAKQSPKISQEDKFTFGGQ